MASFVIKKSGCNIILMIYCLLWGSHSSTSLLVEVRTKSGSEGGKEKVKQRKAFTAVCHFNSKLLGRPRLLRVVPIRLQYLSAFSLEKKLIFEILTCNKRLLLEGERTIDFFVFPPKPIQSFSILHLLRTGETEKGMVNFCRLANGRRCQTKWTTINLPTSSGIHVSIASRRRVKELFFEFFQGHFSCHIWHV